jgi:hypothetical protein
MSLQDTILEAAEELKAKIPAGETIPEESEETAPEEVEELEEETKEAHKEEPDLDQVGLEEAKRLYKALLDPVQRVEIVRALALQSGILDPSRPPETKTEVREAKKEIKQILKEALGPNADFLADKLGPALEQILDQERSEQGAQFQEIRAQQIEREVVSATNELNRLTKGESRKFEMRMQAISQQMPPSSNISVRDYVQNLYTLASGKTLTKGPATTQNNDRVRRNASDVGDRIAPAGGTKGVGTIIPNKKMTAKESVQFAVEQLNKR